MEREGRPGQGYHSRPTPRDHLHLFEKAKTSKELWDAIKLKYENNRSGASIATTVIAVVNKRWESGSLESHISWFRDTNQMLARFQSTPGVGLVADPSDCYHFPPRILSCLLLNSIPSTGDWGTVKATIFTSTQPQAGRPMEFEHVAALLMGEANRLRLDASSRQTMSSAPAAHYISGPPAPSTARRAKCTHCAPRNLPSSHETEECWTLHPRLMPERVQRRRELREEKLREAKRAERNASKKDGKNEKEGKRASRAQQEKLADSSSDSDDPGWARCAVMAEGEQGDINAAPASMRATEAVEETVSVHSTGIKGRSLATNWLVDSGASMHYCHQREMFDTFVPTTGTSRSVILGDGRRIPVVGCGTLRVHVPGCGRLGVVTFNNVQYTPDMAVNLLSVSTLTDDGLGVRFLERDCTIRRGRKVLARARKVANKLFQLTMVKHAQAATQGTKFTDGSALVTQSDVAQMWNQRLGHLNFAALRKLFAEAQVRDEQGVDCERISRALRDAAHESKCEACVLSKSTRKPFPANGATRARKPLELIHMDLCTMPECTIGGAKYFLTIQDDNTRKLWVALLKSKDEALSRYKTWVVAAEAEHSAARHKVLAVRSDNGGEFINRDFDALLAERGSRRERSTAYTPEQNGVAERINRTLLNSVRAMLHDAHLEGRFWGEAVCTAAHIHNRVPTHALGGKTPHEAWSGRKPRVGHMRVFGTLAFAHTPKVGRNKLASRARRCIFVGYETDAKAYRLWDVDAKAIVVSRDVDFWEGVHWASEAAGQGGASVAPQTELSAPLSSSSTRRSNPRRPVRDSVNSESDSESDSDAPGSDIDVPDSDDSNDGSEPAALQPEAIEPPVEDEKDSGPVEEAEEPEPVAAPLPKRRGRKAKSDPNYLPHDLAALRDTNAGGAKDVAPSTVPPRALTTTVTTSDDVERDPKSYKEAMRGPNAKQWRIECEAEIDQQRKMSTYNLVPRPNKHVNVVDNKWVFHSKYNAQGELLKRKARLVAKGFSQRPGVDYFETYSPVVRYSSLRGLLSLAAHHDWEVHHMDVKAAFLNGDLQETVYMRQPEGFEVPGKEDWVCLLEKGLYGLKQAGRVWNLKADKLLRKLGFTPLEADRCVYVFNSEGRMMIVALYVDDMFLFAPRGSDLLPKLKARLQRRFEMTDLGEVSEALGVEIARDRTARTLTITQRRHVRGILERAGMTDCSPATTPMAPGTQLCLPKEGYKATAADTLRYQKALGELNYVAGWTRPDIAFAVSILSKYCSNPSPQHFNTLRHLHRYLRGTQDHGITYRGESDETAVPLLTIYSDADFAACKDDRRSVTGYSVHMCGAAVSWMSARHHTMAQSTVEAEYMASAEAVKEAVWWRSFLRGMGHRLSSPTTVYSDNQGSIALSKNPDSHRRTKHIDVKFHLLREHSDKGTIAMKYIGTNKMPADILTKGLPPAKHRYCAGLLGFGA